MLAQPFGGRVSPAYWGSYPRVALRVLLRAIPGFVFSVGLFFALPALGAVAGFSLMSWPGAAFGVPFTLLACWSAWGFASDLRRLLGLQLVVQLDRPIPDRNGTYFSGAHVVRAVRQLDRVTSSSPISSFIRQPDGPETSPQWFPASEVRTAIAQLLERLDSVDVAAHERDRIRSELERIERDLASAADSGCQCRLVVVACLAMSGRLWKKLLARGFG